jgi:NCS1 family nucleobase:cation symporter-1
VGSYQIFLFAIIGVLLVDYYIIAKGRLDLKWLYTADRSGPYCEWELANVCFQFPVSRADETDYTYGVNWRAITAYVVGAGVNFTGCEWV